MTKYNYYYGETTNGSLFVVKSEYHVIKEHIPDAKFLVKINYLEYLKLSFKTNDKRIYK